MLGQELNFTVSFVLNPERHYGIILPNGSWTGLIRMVNADEERNKIKFHGSFSVRDKTQKINSYTILYAFLGNDFYLLNRLTSADCV